MCRISLYSGISGLYDFSHLIQTIVKILREEHRLGVFENRVLRNLDQRNEVIGGWRKLHNEELHNFYSSPSIIRIINSRRMKWAGHAARMGEKRNAYRIWFAWQILLYSQYWQI
jgi:hypothetical protein